MSNDNIVEIKFKYPDDIIFTLRKFKQYGLQGDYSRFCVLVNQRDERHIAKVNYTIEFYRGLLCSFKRLLIVGCSKIGN